MKTGAILMNFMGFFLLIALIMFFLLTLAGTKDQYSFGVEHLQILRRTQWADTLTIFADQSAKIASEHALDFTASFGGASPRFRPLDSWLGCGMYNGYVLWNTADKECFLDESTATKEYIDSSKLFFENYILSYPALPMPPDNYDVYLTEESTLVFKSKKPIEIPIDFEKKQFDFDKPNNIPAALPGADVNAPEFTFWPTTGSISTCYGWDSGLGYLRWHHGIDISAPSGTPVVAIANGEVIDGYSGCLIGDYSCGGQFGNYVFIKHKESFFSISAHLSYLDVKTGDKVKAGQVIGRVGTTGYSTGSHLHFGFFKVPYPTKTPDDFSDDPFCFIPRSYQGNTDGSCVHRCGS